MNRSCRWAVVLAALLMAASLVFAPREGRAGPAGGRSILPGEPRPTPEMGEPDVPTTPGPCRGNQTPMSVLLIAKTGRLDLMAVLVFVDAHVKSKPTSRPSAGRTRK